MGGLRFFWGFPLEPLSFNIFPYDSMTFEKGKKQQKGGLWIRYVKPHCAERGEIRLQQCCDGVLFELGGSD